VTTTVADQVIQVLRETGVDHIYGLVGDSLNPIADAIRRDGSIRWIHVHNEEAAAFAACADAQLTGKLAVCAGSCGPGNTHLIQGLYDAHRTGAPVLALASHISSGQIGTGYFQETHPDRVFTDCSGYVESLSHPSQMPQLLHIAMRHALAHADVSTVVFPGDITALDAENPSAPTDLTVARPAALPPAERISRLAAMLNEADTVTLFAGAGIRDARDEVLALAGKLHAPIGHALRGKEWIQYDNAYDVGMSGLLGYGACYEACRECDLLLLLGTDFPYDTFLPQAHTIQIDRDAARLGRRTPLDLAVEGDVGATLRAALPLVEQKRSRRFLDQMLRRHAGKLEHVVDAYTHGIEKTVPIHPEYVASVLDDLAADDAVFTVDTGMCNVWAARYLTPNGRRRVIGSFRHGSMANALPHAIGAQVAYPGRQIVSISGDGGLSMLLGELLTVSEHKLPIKIIVFNNGALGMIRLEMMVSGYPYFQTDHGPFHFAGIASACGIPATRIEKPADLRDGLASALASDGPALIDVRTDPNALSLPPHISATQVKGFALAATRTVLDGGVGKMIDLARANLRNIPRP
jgi:pyruvate dehydrogenase (quinone)